MSQEDKPVAAQEPAAKVLEKEVSNLTAQLLEADKLIAELQDRLEN